MIKRIVVIVFLLAGLATTAVGQKTCVLSDGNYSNKLACQVPVVTRAAYPGTLGNPAAVFSSSFATQLGQLPLLSSGSGVILSLDKSLGVYVASENLGPILTDRAQTIGKHKLLLAFAFQKFVFNSIDGTNLNQVPFVFAASTSPSKTVGCTSAGSIICLTQTDRISMNVNQYVGLATFGINAKTDVSVILPFERVAIGVYGTGSQYFINNGAAQGPPATFTSYAPGSASGVGDLYINVKRLMWSGEHTSVAGGMLFRFPTGEALNYLGSGAYGFDPYAVLAYQYHRISPHVRLAYQFNTSSVLVPKFTPDGTFTGYGGLPGGFQYFFGADYVLFKKIPTTLAADYLGNYIINAPVLKPATVAVPGYNVPDQPTLTQVTNSYNSAQLSIGFKIKPVANLILYGNALFQLNNVGLRSEPVPLVGISYTF